MINVIFDLLIQMPPSRNIKASKNEAQIFSMAYFLERSILLFSRLSPNLEPTVNFKKT